jgi:hypothetical protein
MGNRSAIRVDTWLQLAAREREDHFIRRAFRANELREGRIDLNWPEVRYEYVLGNRRIVGDRIRFIVRGMNEEQTRQVVSAYPPGKSVTVYFDPNDATSAVLEPGIWWPTIPILAFSMTLPFVSAASLYSDVRTGN